MVDFISEVEEELRKDDYNKFLRKYGPAIIGLLVAIVGVVAFLEWRDYAQDRTARAAAASYLNADEFLVDSNLDEASQAFLELADVAPDGYAGLSLMRAAIIAGDSGNAAEAVRLYDAAAARFDLTRHKDLAELKAAYVLANQGQWTDVDRRAGDLMSEGAPYEFLARELVASAAFNLSDMDRAREQFTYLDTVPGVPQTIAQRAGQALTLLDNVANDAAVEDLSMPDETDAPSTPDSDISVDVTEEDE